MSRSFKKAFFSFMTVCSDPKSGKEMVSRKVRRKVKEKITNIFRNNEDIEDGDFVNDIQDVKRGTKGSKESDFGWDYWGDGHFVIFSEAELEKAYGHMKNFSVKKMLGK